MPMTSGPADFPTTRWTLVAAAGDPDRPDCGRALESLCEAHWYPLYVYARRSGDSAEEAQDHTQEFFTRFLEHNYFDRTDRDRGRFRSFLLSSCKYYRRDQADRLLARAAHYSRVEPAVPVSHDREGAVLFADSAEF